MNSTPAPIVTGWLTLMLSPRQHWRREVWTTLNRDVSLGSGDGDVSLGSGDGIEQPFRSTSSGHFLVVLLFGGQVLAECSPADADPRDTIYGDATGAEELYGGWGDDRIYGSDDDDEMHGDE